MADLIFAGAGDDVVDGLGGDHCIDLGPGADRGRGGSGADLLVGDLGADRLSGSSGNDRLRGGSGGDRLIGGLGDDTLHGQSGSDRINGERGRDRLNGGSSNDVISAGSSNDRVAGDQGNDRINGNSGNDSLLGNSGRDLIKGSSGSDRLWGGGGNDRVDARDGRRDHVSCGGGRDTRSGMTKDRVWNCRELDWHKWSGGTTQCRPSGGAHVEAHPLWLPSADPLAVARHAVTRVGDHRLADPGLPENPKQGVSPSPPLRTTCDTLADRAVPAVSLLGGCNKASADRARYCSRRIEIGTTLPLYDETTERQ